MSHIPWHTKCKFYMIASTSLIFTEFRDLKRGEIHSMSLISDGGKFHQYQQNGKSPPILVHCRHTKNPMTYEVGNPGLTFVMLYTYVAKY